MSVEVRSKDSIAGDATRKHAGRRQELAMKATRQVGFLRSSVAMLCAFCLLPGETFAFAASQQTAPAQSSAQGTKLSSNQLDSLVAPIALYSDPLLAQVLAASTYSLEIIELQQWLANNPNLKDKALADAVAKQPWDASVQALAPMPEAVKRLANDIGWTTNLGNAFLAQQSEVMDAVQRMRQKAQNKGNLKTTEQQKVETRVVENKQVIVIEPPSTQVVYVPTYDPYVVYGPPLYPYPAIYYPPAWYYPAGMAISFGMGVMMGAFWSGGWGWGCGWGGNDIYINRDNNFNRNTNINRGNRVNNDLPGRGGNRGNVGGVGGVGGAGGIGGVGGVGGPGGAVGGNRPSQLPASGRDNWQHNPQHRSAAPYQDRATADRFGGLARGDSSSRRQESARQQISRQGGALANNRVGNGGAFGGDRSAGGSNRFSGGGSERIGSRAPSNSTGIGNRDSFGGGSRGFDGTSVRSISRGGGGFNGGLNRGGGGGRGGIGRGR
jgi:hypothetical protein